MEPTIKNNGGILTMKLCENFPIYLNPTFQELCELSKHWDTLRICINDNNNDFLVASGYGNTHNTIWQYYKQIDKRAMLSCFIMYKENGIVYLNTEDVGGNERDRRWTKYFNAEHIDIIKDIINQSELNM
jgi:hypothetical protein